MSGSGKAKKSQSPWTLFSYEPDGDLWRGFFPCLFAAFLLRVVAGLSGDWIVRADEVYQYLEQAHRMVFGYGQVPWEYQLGLRSYFLPAFSASILWVCKGLGFEHPGFYIPAVKIAHSLVSLTIPVGMYLFGRRLCPESVARCMLILGCFWYEFIILASHAFAEHYSAIFFFLALACLKPKLSFPQLFFVGLLLGVALVFRPAYLYIFIALGAALLVTFSYGKIACLMAGGLVAFLAYGWVDYLTWGKWWHTFFVLPKVSEIVYTDMSLDAEPPGLLFEYLFRSSYGLYFLSFFSLLAWRKHWPLLGLAAAGLLSHTIYQNKEYTNIFMILPLLWMLIAAILPMAAASVVKGQISGKMVAGMAMGLVGLGGAISLKGVPPPEGALYRHGGDLGHPRLGFLYSFRQLFVAGKLSEIPSSEMRGVVWNSGLQHSLGGYYYLHHRVPLLFPKHVAEHRRMVEEANGDLKTLASHVIDRPDQRHEGFRLEAVHENYAIFVNEDLSRVDVPNYFSTKYDGPPWTEMRFQFEKHDLYLPERKEYLLNE